jgi:hypothetical protein
MLATEKQKIKENVMRLQGNEEADDDEEEEENADS